MGATSATEVEEAVAIKRLVEPKNLGGTQERFLMLPDKNMN